MIKLLVIRVRGRKQTTQNQRYLAGKHLEIHNDDQIETFWLYKYETVTIQITQNLQEKNSIRKKTTK